MNVKRAKISGAYTKISYIPEKSCLIDGDHINMHVLVVEVRERERAICSLSRHIDIIHCTSDQLWWFFRVPTPKWVLETHASRRFDNYRTNGT